MNAARLFGRVSDSRMAQAARVAQAAVPFLTAPLIVRDTGVDGLGRWVVLQAVVQIPFILDLGLADLSFQQALARHPKRANTSLLILFAWQGAATVLVYLGFNAISSWRVASAVLLPFLVFTSALYPALLVSVANGRARNYYIALAVGQALAVVAFGLLYLFRVALTVDVLAVVMTASLAMPLTAGLRQYRGSAEPQDVGYADFRADVRFAAAQQMNNATNYALFAIDRLMFVAIGGYAATAVWDVGSKMAAFARTLVTAQLPLWQRRVAGIDAEQVHSLSRTYFRTWALPIGASVILAVPYAVWWVGLRVSEWLVLSVIASSVISGLVLSTGLVGVVMRQTRVIRPELFANAFSLVGKAALCLVVIYGGVSFLVYVSVSAAVVAVATSILFRGAARTSSEGPSAQEVL